MRLRALCIAASLGSALSYAQALCGIPTRLPASAAVAALEQIETAVGFEHGTIQLFASSDRMVKDRSGAVSVQCPVGNALQRWILYDPDLIKGDSLYFALAHETAHHLNNDPMSGEAPSKQQELTADRLAARYLARSPLNWTNQRLLQALDALQLPTTARGGYPSQEERRAQVNEGFREESARLTPPAPEPAPPKVSSSPPPASSASTRAPTYIVDDQATYVWIPPGKFKMGCSAQDRECDNDENPSHDISITKGFWLGRTEVTQEAYQKITGNNPSYFKGAKLPVEQISWGEADAYCRAAGGRLPTEAEWEYAARAGSPQSRYGVLDNIAWYRENSGGKTHEVRQKPPNAWGLYDMLGNVWEWVADWYADALPSGDNDPKGPPSGEHRGLRGGSWQSVSKYVRASDRGESEPGVRNSSRGVRCVANLPTPGGR